MSSNGPPRTPPSIERAKLARHSGPPVSFEVIAGDGDGWTLMGDGLRIPVRLRRHPRARRISLRLSPETAEAALTLPRAASRADGAAFVHERADWLAARWRGLPPAVPFAAGAPIPLLDMPHAIRHDPGHRGAPAVANREIRIGGRLEHLPRRMRDWLAGRARDEITPRAHALADRLERRVARVTVRDTRSRWGSCSPAGNLSFCWRLVMAPEWVLQYVVAHEVAHLVEANHAKAFWAVVDRLDVDAPAARAWLRANGDRLRGLGCDRD